MTQQNDVDDDEVLCGGLRLEPGSLEWWRGASEYGPRGIVASVLRLLEQEEVSRAKALELLEYMHRHRWESSPPSAPWSRLTWADGGTTP